MLWYHQSLPASSSATAGGPQLHTAGGHNCTLPGATTAHYRGATTAHYRGPQLHTARGPQLHTARGPQLHTARGHNCTLPGGHNCTLPGGHNCTLPGGHNCTLPGGHNCTLPGGHNCTLGLAWLQDPAADVLPVKLDTIMPARCIGSGKGSMHSSLDMMKQQLQHVCRVFGISRRACNNHTDHGGKSSNELQDVCRPQQQMCCLPGWTPSCLQPTLAAHVHARLNVECSTRVAEHQFRVQIATAVAPDQGQVMNCQALVAISLITRTGRSCGVICWNKGKQKSHGYGCPP
jgi:hypothetical protein